MRKIFKTIGIICLFLLIASIVYPDSFVGGRKIINAYKATITKYLKVGSDSAATVDKDDDLYVEDDIEAGGNITLTGTLSCATGSPNEIHAILRPQSAKLPSSNPAVIDATNSGWRLLFDAGDTVESAYWEFDLDDDYGGGTLYCDIYFSMASGEANEVQWECNVMAYTPTTDTADWDTDSFDTANEGTATTVAATAGRVYKQTVTLTNDDSAAAGDSVRIQIQTDADDATNDDATGDREFRLAVIRE